MPAWRFGAVTLIGCHGQKLAMADGPPATVGIERISFIADNAGRIIVEIHALDRFPDRGRYRVVPGVGAYRVTEK
jgi:hypothetical protein